VHSYEYDVKMTRSGLVTHLNGLDGTPSHRIAGEKLERVLTERHRPAHPNATARRPVRDDDCYRQQAISFG
jgi:hypothetical protein